MYSEDIPSSADRLTLQETFSFSCHADLPCFNTCCRKKFLPLTPYDVLRLTRALKLHSDAFLVRYTRFGLDQNTGFPIVSLAMTDDAGQRCPFVGEKGCGVYDDRPTACRLYPLGRIAIKGGAFYHLLETPSCLGRQEERSISVEHWIEEQGLSPFIAMNDRMLDVVYHPDRNRDERLLGDGQLQKVFVAVYNLDVFRAFVKETDFPVVYRIDRPTLNRIEEDDEALLMLGIAYLMKELYRL
jgi:Fe-S-cluster containining protein